MKLILTSSVIAMISAGLYGAFDFGSDVKNGTLIDYRHNFHFAKHALARPFFTSSGSDALKEQVASNIERKKKEEEEKKKLEEQQRSFSFSDFSREAPPLSPEEYRTLELEDLRTDSIAQSQVSTQVQEENNTENNPH